MRSEVPGSEVERVLDGRGQRDRSAEAIKAARNLHFSPTAAAGAPHTAALHSTIRPPLWIGTRPRALIDGSTAYCYKPRQQCRQPTLQSQSLTNQNIVAFSSNSAAKRWEASPASAFARKQSTTWPARSERCDSSALKPLLSSAAGTFSAGSAAASG